MHSFYHDFQGFSSNLVDNRRAFGNSPSKLTLQFEATVYVPYAYDPDDDGTHTYTWDFGCDGDCDPADSSDQNPETTFTKSGTYNVQLSVSDDTGDPVCSSGTKPVQVGGSFRIPLWKEIAPW